MTTYDKIETILKQRNNEPVSRQELIAGVQQIDIDFGFIRPTAVELIATTIWLMIVDEKLSDDNDRIRLNGYEPPYIQATFVR